MINYKLIKNFQKYNKIYTIIYRDYDLTIVRDDGINGLFINRFIALKEYKIESFVYLVDNEDFTKFNFSNKKETENIKSKLNIYSLYLLNMFDISGTIILNLFIGSCLSTLITILSSLGITYFATSK